MTKKKAIEKQQKKLIGYHRATGEEGNGVRILNTLIRAGGINIYDFKPSNIKKDEYWYINPFVNNCIDFRLDFPEEGILLQLERDLTYLEQLEECLKDVIEYGEAFKLYDDLSQFGDFFNIARKLIYGEDRPETSVKWWKSRSEQDKILLLKGYMRKFKPELVITLGNIPLRVIQLIYKQQVKQNITQTITPK